MIASPGGPDFDRAAYPRFSAAEYARRHAAVERIRAEGDVDALVVYGNLASRHDIQYLTAWPPRQEAVLVVAADEPPALFVQLFNHVPNAREMAVLERVEWAGPDTAETVAGELRRLGAARVGVVGPMPHQLHARIGALSGAALVDLTHAFRTMRLRKSDEEIAWTRSGAALCDEALRALVRDARPGLREYELGALVEHAYARLGGQHGICFLATAPMRGGGRFVPAQNWSSRRLESGDAILIELSAGVGGYTGQVLRTIAVGDPPPAFRRLHEVADAAFRSIVGVIRPGASAADLLAAAELIDRAGFSVCDDVVHGYGGGYLPPVLRTPATSHRPPPDLRLEAGMLLVVQPNVVAIDRSSGVQTGELVVVTETGHEALHTIARGLLTAGGTA
ncbi:MAG TPA: M24 family metallopeptidase [Candidatus Limnocylindrales bacterium]|nr:M24 family metallopeptidase [Candidatus Limnocylindrales bacterium]